MQADDDVHDTLLRKANCAPLGVGVAWMLQLAPFHRSASVPALDTPTAAQADDDVHDTLVRKPPPCGGLAVVWTRHLVPFHCSASVPALDAPTAVQADEDIQDTPESPPPPCDGLGVAWICQFVPFHLSASVPALEVPTAVQADEEVQDTPLRKPPPWGGLGVVWMRQLVPFQRSTTAWEAPALDVLAPTAVHADGAVQETPSRPLNAIPGGLGVARMRHDVPFHCSARLTPTPEVLTYVPTAMHELAVGQVTQKSWPVGISGFGLGVIDHPDPEALAGVAKAPIRMAAAASDIGHLAALPIRLNLRRQAALHPLATSTRPNAASLETARDKLISRRAHAVRLMVTPQLGMVRRRIASPGTRRFGG
ncbi:MAG TPA: hypothetical protein VF916_09745 [Ktedonobacterales bacterium]